MDAICAFLRDGECMALTKKDCLNCAFFKTERELMADRKKAAKRLQKVLSPIEYKATMDKYYGGEEQNDTER